MPQMHYITPFMRVTDIDAAVAFFTGTLGFKVSIRAGIYGFVYRDNAAFRLIEARSCRPAAAAAT